MQKTIDTMPGMIDSHLHLLALGKTQDEIDLSDMTTIEAMIGRVNDAGHRGPVVARDFDQTRMEGQRMPDKHDLNRISTRHPVLFRRVCRHMCVVNDVLLNRIMAMDTRHVNRLIDVEKGHLFEHAVMLADKALGTPDMETMVRYIELAGRRLERHGVVAVASDDFATFDLPYDAVIDAYRQAYRDGRLRVKVIQQMRFPDLGTFQGFLKRRQLIEPASDLTLGPLKLLADGSLGARTAALWDDYADDPGNRGIMTMDDDALRTWIRTAHDHDMDVHVHAIGDRAAAKTVQAIGRVLDEAPRNHRHALIHAQITDDDTIGMMRDYDVSAIVQPVFLDRDLAIVGARLGQRRKLAYRFHRMLEAGIPVGFSSDAPIETTDPFRGMYHAMTRRSLMDPGLDALGNDTPFTNDEAFRAYTDVNMRILGLSKSPGSMVLNEHPLTADADTMRHIRVKETIFRER